MCNLVQPANIGTRLEMFAGAADHQTSYAGVGRQTLQPEDQSIQHRRIICIADLGAVQRHRGDPAVVDVQQDDILTQIDATFPGSVLPPQTTTPTRAPSGGTNRPDSSAA